MSTLRDISDVADDLFQVFETLRNLFQHWTKESPSTFFDEMERFRALETELQTLTGDETSTRTIIRGLYHCVFPPDHPSGHDT